MYTFVQICVQKLCSQFVYGGVNEQRHWTHVHPSTLLYDCSRFLHGFVRWQRQGAGCGASTATCNSASWRQFCAIALRGGSHWLLEMSPGPDDPDGWGSKCGHSQSAPICQNTGGTDKKHWRDGRSMIRPRRFFGFFEKFAQPVQGWSVISFEDMWSAFCGFLGVEWKNAFTWFPCTSM